MSDELTESQILADAQSKNPTMPKLTAKAVHSVFMDCLFRDEELTDGQPPEGFVEAHGVMAHVGFHPGRLKENSGKIKALLMELPETFRQKSGGGWSFLQACVDRFEEQWGEHVNVDELLCLGVASGQARILMPREMWSALPGGMPYFMIVEE
jgi:hypothetical protein